MCTLRFYCSKEEVTSAICFLTADFRGNCTVVLGKKVQRYQCDYSKLTKVQPNHNCIISQIVPFLYLIMLQKYPLVVCFYDIVDAMFCFGKRCSVCYLLYVQCGAYVRYGQYVQLVTVLKPPVINVVCDNFKLNVCSHEV